MECEDCFGSVSEVWCWICGQLWMLLGFVGGTMVVQGCLSVLEVVVFEFGVAANCWVHL